MKNTLLSLLLILFFSSNSLKASIPNYHQHVHNHNQTIIQISEHIHSDSSLLLYLKLDFKTQKEFTFKTNFIDIKNEYFMPIINNIFRPPII